MQDRNKQQFINFAIGSGALAFGEYQLKSGRSSPYFFNTGVFNEGADLYRLCAYYATAINEAGVEFNQIFGPAYKGIPLACSLAAVLDNEYSQRVSFCSNRKEAKTHGDTGSFLGAKPEGKVLIIDDVLTSGSSIRSSVDILRAAGAEPVAAVVALDRREPGLERTAAEEIRGLGLDFISIVGLTDMLDWMATKDEFTEDYQAMLAHTQQLQQ